MQPCRRSGLTHPTGRCDPHHHRTRRVAYLVPVCLPSNFYEHRHAHNIHSASFGLLYDCGALDNSIKDDAAAEQQVDVLHRSMKSSFRPLNIVGGKCTSTGLQLELILDTRCAAHPAARDEVLPSACSYQVRWPSSLVLIPPIGPTGCRGRDTRWPGGLSGPRNRNGAASLAAGWCNALGSWSMG